MWTVESGCILAEHVLGDAELHDEIFLRQSITEPLLNEQICRLDSMKEFGNALMLPSFSELDASVVSFSEHGLPCEDSYSMANGPGR